MSYFSFLGHFEKDRVFISWLSERPYASLLLGLLGCSRDTQSPWALDNLLNVDKWVECLMAINLPPGSSPRLLVNVLERGPPRYPATWGSHLEKTDQQRHGGKGHLSPICNWNTDLFPADVLIEDNRGWRSLFTTCGWSPEWEGSVTDSLCDFKQSWAALDLFPCV